MGNTVRCLILSDWPGQGQRHEAPSLRQRRPFGLVHDTVSSSSGSDRPSAWYITEMGARRGESGRAEEAERVQGGPRVHAGVSSRASSAHLWLLSG